VIKSAFLVLILMTSLMGVADAAPGRADVHQDAPRLTWLTPGFLPPDGLLTLGLRGTYDTPMYVDNNFGEYMVWRFGLFADWTPLPGVALSYSQEWRQYSNYYYNDVQSSGSGIADGAWRVTAALPWMPEDLGLSAWGGGNVPYGSDIGGEGSFSPELGVSFSMAFWRDSQLPEMRLHASLGRRWNSNEAEGYGAQHQEIPQIWFPQYPSAEYAGGEANNDFLIYGLAVEFRQKTTALWLEWSEYKLTKANGVWDREDQKILSAGLRWGLEEGWAMHANYEVGFQRDEPVYTEWYPRQPDNRFTFAFSRQFSVGGQDKDDDGIPDRRDQCPDEPEDLDGFQDEDGCPDPDNDEDGIPDIVDESPFEPEDYDGWMDDDGVPDPDNDGDGIPDYRDLCPMQAEDFDGYQDTDGCPEEFMDRDGDGVADEDDLCPDSPEDLDGFQDEDGCPDPDNDLDGIDDADDECPDEPEDYDGDRDDDGCPDLTEEEQQDKDAADEAEAAGKQAEEPEEAVRTRRAGAGSGKN